MSARVTPKMAPPRPPAKMPESPARPGRPPPVARPPPDDKEPEADFCSAQSHVSGNYFSLAALTEIDDLTIRSPDLPYNFTISICRPLNGSYAFSDITDKGLVAAMYSDEQGDHSLGQLSTEPYLRGRSLLLQYENGSPCLDSAGNATPFRKTSTFSFKCDRELPHERAAAVSFVASPNNCSYFFDVRTSYACPSMNAKETVHPLTLFFVITLVAFVVYTAGTCVLRPANVVVSVARMKNALHRKLRSRTTGGTAPTSTDAPYAKLYSNKPQGQFDATYP